MILNAVWGNAVFVTPRSIDRCVTTLRAKVEPDPHRPIYIQTIREIGYRFEPNGDVRLTSRCAMTARDSLAKRTEARSAEASLVTTHVQTSERSPCLRASAVVTSEVTCDCEVTCT